MRLRVPAGRCALLEVSYLCLAQSRQASQSASITQWRLEPTVLNGQPGEVETTISVLFSFHHDVSGIGKTADWTNFMGAYEDATSGIWLEGIPSSSQKGKVTASVTLRRGGVIDRGVRLTHSWGDAAIDCATRVAIQKSVPLHGLPSDLSEPTIAVRVRCAYDDPHATAPPSGAAQ